jgi:hypothetical protein
MATPAERRRAPRGKGRRLKEIPRPRRGTFASSPSSAPRLSASRRSAGGREREGEKARGGDAMRDAMPEGRGEMEQRDAEVRARLGLTTEEGKLRHSCGGFNGKVAFCFVSLGSAMPTYMLKL